MTVDARGLIKSLGMNILNTELSSLEGTRGEFNRRTRAIKLGIDVHQEFYVVVEQEGGSNPKPAQRFGRRRFCLGGEAEANIRARSARGLRSVRVWFWIAASN